MFLTTILGCPRKEYIIQPSSQNPATKPPKIRTNEHIAFNSEAMFAQVMSLHHGSVPSIHVGDKPTRAPVDLRAYLSYFLESCRQ